MTNADSKTQPTHDEIASRAYQLWQADGCRAGKDQEYWYQAIAHLTANKPGSTPSQGRRETAPATTGAAAQPAPATNPSNAGKTDGQKKRKAEGQAGRRQPAFA